MVGVGVHRHEAVGLEDVGDALHALACDPEAPGNAWDRPVPLAEDAQDLPARLGLACRAGVEIALTSERACGLEDVGYQER